MQKAVNSGRSDMGSVIVFAAGDGRAQANDLALQPIPADPRVIAVAASDADGQVASYSTGGAALLVAAVGDNVAVPMPAGQAPGYVSGTSYAAASVSAIVGMMLSANPNLGWRDVQEILADSAYMPAPSAASFTFNGATFWNGGGMHFSDALGFGVVDANVAVNLARAWPTQNWSDSSNLVTTTVTQSTATTVGINATARQFVKLRQRPSHPACSGHHPRYATARGTHRAGSYLAGRYTFGAAGPARGSGRR